MRLLGSEMWSVEGEMEDEGQNGRVFIPESSYLARPAPWIDRT